jgi:hypothetical protein
MSDWRLAYPFARLSGRCPLHEYAPRFPLLETDPSARFLQLYATGMNATRIWNKREISFNDRFNRPMLADGDVFIIERRFNGIRKRQARSNP